jgi:hypothetical protein
MHNPIIKTTLSATSVASSMIAPGSDMLLLLIVGTNKIFRVVTRGQGPHALTHLAHRDPYNTLHCHPCEDF